MLVLLGTAYSAPKDVELVSKDGTIYNPSGPHSGIPIVSSTAMMSPSSPTVP